MSCESMRFCFLAALQPSFRGGWVPTPRESGPQLEQLADPHGTEVNTGGWKYNDVCCFESSLLRTGKPRWAFLRVSNLFIALQAAGSRVDFRQHHRLVGCTPNHQRTTFFLVRHLCCLIIRYPSLPQPRGWQGLHRTARLS